jgi:hypothetical protein
MQHKQPYYLMYDISTPQLFSSISDRFETTSEPWDKMYINKMLSVWRSAVQLISLQSVQS